MASPLSSITNELQLLHFLLDEPERVVAIKDNYFISSDGHDLYEVLFDLYQQGVKPTKENLVGAGNCVNEKITPELIDKINSTNDVASLVSIYLDNTQVIESNSELKSLLTNRKKALQTLNAA